MKYSSLLYGRLFFFLRPSPFFFNRAENYVRYNIRGVYHSRALFYIFTLTFSPCCASREPTKRRKKANTLQGEKPFRKALRKGDWKLSRGCKHAEVSCFEKRGADPFCHLDPVFLDYLNAGASRGSHQCFEYFQKLNEASFQLSLRNLFSPLALPVSLSVYSCIWVT